MNEAPRLRIPPPPRGPLGKLWRSGEPLIWLTGSALDIALIMVAGLVLLVLVNGMGFFWPSPVVRLDLEGGDAVLGQVMEREAIPHSGSLPGAPRPHRIQVKQGNRDLLGADFRWVDESAIRSRDVPAQAVVVERLEWGNLYGELREVREEGKPVAQGPEAAWTALQERLPAVRDVLHQIRGIERDEVGEINLAQETIRLRRKALERQGSAAGPETEALDRESAALDARYRETVGRAQALRETLQGSVVVVTAQGTEKELPLHQVVRAYRPNAMSFGEKAGFYLKKVWEFVAEEPRESNTEGGVFPAIFGTVMMVMIMSVLVTPLGVLAAFYLREYARQGPLVSAVRIAVNNLAGVPSIVFGVFGVGFFIYFLGGSIDRLFYSENLPSPTFGTGGIFWASLTLSLLTVPVVIVATEEGLAAIPRGLREASMALGATRFETTWRVVFPAVVPSILTGLILAMARAAGEVAPLMITGVVKLAPSLAVDGVFPYVHLERKFMHLGFHIYDVGFQAPNVDAARPMVFTTTLLLVLIVLALNLTAIFLRTRLRKRHSLAAL